MLIISSVENGILYHVLLIFPIQGLRLGLASRKGLLRLPNSLLKSGKRRKGRKLRCPDGSGHLRPCLGNMAGKAYNIIITLSVSLCAPLLTYSTLFFRAAAFTSFHHPLLSAHALWPPIWRFLSTVMAPSSRFIPLSMAFFPYRFLISSMASCIFLSRLSSAAWASFNLSLSS